MNRHPPIPAACSLKPAACSDQSELKGSELKGTGIIFVDGLDQTRVV